MSILETGNLIVAVDPRYFRPTEVETLLGDPSKAKEKLRLGAKNHSRRSGQLLVTTALEDIFNDSE